ncbi:MAG: sugar ABC transporter ATP-binding protein [Microbacteriaceae bacterium]|nr:sugar ABC transporter ATP-binding protein [Microbacteriaceae bacterium]
MTTPRLELDAISHSFYGVPVNKGISLDVYPGEVLGLVGENGAGKSTLMNIVAGVINPLEGKRKLDGEDFEPSSPADARSAGVSFVHQELNLFSQLSVADNLFLTDYPTRGGVFTDKAGARRRALDALARMDLPFQPQTVVEDLSPGERQMLEICKATIGEPRLMILDEPTTSLTSRETSRLFALIRQLTEGGTSIIYVSHILEDVKSICDRIAIMRDGTLVDVRPAESLPTSELITLMVGRPLDHLFPERANSRGSSPLLQVTNLSATGLIDSVDMTVSEGEVVGVFGLMGAGRTELARVIAGLEQATEGTVHLDGVDVTQMSPRGRIAQGLSFVTEDRRGEGLFMDYSVMTNVALPSLKRWASNVLAPLRRRSMRDAVDSSTSKLRLAAPNIDRAPVRNLSGGNQQKVVLAKWLLTGPKVLILDEPTRGVDVGAQFEVYRTTLEIADAGAAVLVISSELPELLGICDRIVVMRLGRLVQSFDREEFDARLILGAAFGESKLGESA